MAYMKPLLLVVVLYVLRGALMNSSAPMTQSILVDCVKPEHRSRWTALQSLSRATWSGSAFMGGWLADSHSYRFTFLITAWLYTWGCGMWVPVARMLPKEKPN